MAAVDAPIVSGTESLDSMNSLRQELPPSPPTGPPTGESVSSTEISFASQTKKRKLTNEFVDKNIIVQFWDFYSSFYFSFFLIFCVFMDQFFSNYQFQIPIQYNLYKRENLGQILPVPCSPLIEVALYKPLNSHDFHFT